MGSAVAGGRTFTRAWDRFVLAWPFSRVVLVLGAPLGGETPARALHDAIVRANDSAQGLLTGTTRKVLPLLKFSSGVLPETDVLEKN